MINVRPVLQHYLWSWCWAFSKDLLGHFEWCHLVNDQLLPFKMNSHEDFRNPKSGDMSNTLQLRHNWRDGVSNHRRINCLPNILFRRRSKKTSRLRITGFCVGKPLVTSGFPSQMAMAVAQKIIPSDDVITKSRLYVRHQQIWNLIIRGSIMRTTLLMKKTTNIGDFLHIYVLSD